MALRTLSHCLAVLQSKSRSLSSSFCTPSSSGSCSSSSKKSCSSLDMLWSTHAAIIIRQHCLMLPASTKYSLRKRCLSKPNVFSMATCSCEWNLNFFFFSTLESCSRGHGMGSSGKATAGMQSPRRYPLKHLLAASSKKWALPKHPAVVGRAQKTNEDINKPVPVITYALQNHWQPLLPVVIRLRWHVRFVDFDVTAVHTSDRVMWSTVNVN